MYPPLDDGNPDGFTLSPRFADALLQAMQPDAGVHHHALELVLPHKDAALRIVRIIACMDADALEPLDPETLPA